MKNYKIIVLLGYILSFIGIAIVVYSYFRVSLSLFFLGAVIILLGFLSVISLMGLNLFFKDKELEIEKLREMGLSIVTCQACLKENVLEDQYCIYCGERLGSDDNGVQKEYKA